VKPHPDEYGVIISAGWSDPTGSEAKKIIPIRVTVEKLLHKLLGVFQFALAQRWHFYVGVNGRWKVFENQSLRDVAKKLSFTVDLDLHPTDRVHVTVCGFGATSIHKLMGKPTGLPSNTVSERTTKAQAIEGAKAIRSKFLSLLPSIPSGNDPVPLLSQHQLATAVGEFTAVSADKSYKLQYRISRR
jgi:hypothetical protein